MLFTSYAFAAFLALLVPVYYLCPARARWMTLLAGSLVFYAWSGPDNLACLTLTILSSYAAGRAIGKLHDQREAFFSANKETLTREDKKRLKAQNQRARRRWLTACLCLNLGFLAAVKYAAFAVGGLNLLLGAAGTETLPLPNLMMPMAVSFYTFQAMGYVIDVYRGTICPERSLPRLALFCSFFPQMVQGPISRYADLSALYRPNAFDPRNLSCGARRLLLGFFKKLVIADRLLTAVKTVTQDPDTYHGAYAAAGILLYAVTLYADFTGGIDIALGAAQMLGVRLKENFNRPFYAVSIADYWRRWHITMGTWFKDYLFYPVSVSGPMLTLSKRARAALGNGFGRRVPVYLSTLSVWLATGAWHGASWNFIVWGLANGWVIVLSEECSPLYRRFHARFPALGQSNAYRAFQILRTFCLMSAIRSFDIYPSVTATLRALASIFTRLDLPAFLRGGLTALGLSAADYAAAFSAVALLMVIGRLRPARLPPVLRYASVILLLLAVLVFGAYGHGYDAGQFIYNRF